MKNLMLPFQYIKFFIFSYSFLTFSELLLYFDNLFRRIARIWSWMKIIRYMNVDPRFCMTSKEENPFM